MMNQSKPLFLLLLLLLLLVYLQPTPTAAQEADDEREFDYLEEGEKGPKRWGELKEEWAACKHGKQQSPIDLLRDDVEVLPHKGELKLKYKPGNATIKNRGHDISVQWELGDAGSIELDGTDYLLQQCHWHSPSEHTIEGKRFDMELHMVHLIPDEKVENNIVVVSYLYKLGKPDQFLSEVKCPKGLIVVPVSKVSNDIKSMIDLHEERQRGMVDPRHVRRGGKKYYKYIGSLTVPPCTEGVTWIIHKKSTTVSREQMELLREAVHDSAELNARPLQALNSRDLHFHGPKSHIRD